MHYRVSSGLLASAWMLDPARRLQATGANRLNNKLTTDIITPKKKREDRARKGLAGTMNEVHTSWGH